MNGSGSFPRATEHCAATSGGLADDWNERLESWCYVEDTPLAREVGVRGYYLRIAPLGRSIELSSQVQLAIATARRRRRERA